MKKLIFFIIILSFSLSFSQDLPELTYRSPYNTIYVHLRYLQTDVNQPEIAAKTLNVADPSSEYAEKMAIELKQIMDGKLLFVDLDKLPKDPNYVDTITNRNIYVLFDSEPSIYVEKVDGRWLYSKETVDAIPTIHRLVYPFGTGFISKMIPEWANKKFLGMRIWKYGGLFIYLVLSITLYVFFTWVFAFFVRWLFGKFAKKNVFEKYIRPVSKPLSLLFVTWLIVQYIPILQLPITFGKIVGFFIKAAQPIALTFIAYRLTDLIGDILAKLATKTETQVDDNLVPLVRKAMKVIVVIVGGIYFVDQMGWEITPLLAGASIGGLAFALAAQDTVKNLFGGVTLFTDQPFDIGDWIVFNGQEGMVEEVGVRTTRIRTFYNSLISIPNGKLADSVIDNMGKRQYRRYSTKIGITYDTPPDLIDAFVDGLNIIVKEHPNTRKDYYQIHLNSFANSAIEILFYIFFEVPDWEQELKSRHQIISATIRLADELGVRFAFPTQTIHVENFPDKSSLTPEYNENRQEFMKKVKSYFSRKNGGQGQLNS